jgi:RNA polymerase primary sigma factor
MNKLLKSTNKLEQEYERNPSLEELESDSGISADKISLNSSSIAKTISLDTPFKDESGCLLDIIPDEPEIQKNQDISPELKAVLSKLSTRESDVLKMIYGIEMYPMSYNEIGDLFGLTPERIRQIQTETIIKIRNNYKDVLRELL